jgi:hypothetical protein
VILEKTQRRQVIVAYAERSKIDTLVETGTYLGETPLELSGNFNQIITIELDRLMADQARERLKHLTNVTVMEGDSSERLSEALLRSPGPVVAWLDGHYSGPGTARGNIDTPIKAELLILFQDVLVTGRRHIILIDDARLFKGGEEHTEEFADYPSLAWVKHVAEEHGYSYEMKDDIIRLT